MMHLIVDMPFCFQFCSNPCNLGDSLSGEEVVVRSLADEVGQRPVGIPVTAEVSHLPPVIFQTKSLHHYLQIGSLPWKYLVCETDGLFKVGKNAMRFCDSFQQLFLRCSFVILGPPRQLKTAC